VAVLENIKHLFSVKGIVFVLSIDKEQLGHAVCGVYGSEKMDSDEYLRRFIDVEYSLPVPELKNYIEYLMEAHKLNEFFNLDQRQNVVLSSETESFVTITELLFRLRSLTLRQQEKVMRHAGITLRSFDSKQYIIPELLIYLIYLRLFHNKLYFQIKNRELKHQKLIDEIESTLYGTIKHSTHRDLRIIIEAFMLLSYNEYLDPEDKLIELSRFDENVDFKVNSKFDNSENQRNFKYYIKNEKENIDRRGRVPIDYLIKKIDLIEPLQDM